ncbi:MAG TPA: type II toxin-antitoxin system HicA family toxin [Longimicrobium sp.]|nr:type II toxin-antitoxin system HicA family toxin [Longimicrobium sp.]
MNSRHRKTLEAIFADPVRTNIHYLDLESLFVALGAEVNPNRAGSRVAVALHGVRYSYHRPHPENEIGRKTVKDVRDFLTAAGVEP